MVQTVAGCDSQLGTEGGQIGLHAWTKRRPARSSSFYEAEASFELSDWTSRSSARFVASQLGPGLGRIWICHLRPVGDQVWLAVC
jgi:hypothetical protein